MVWRSLCHVLWEYGSRDAMFTETWCCSDETGQHCLFLHILWHALDQSRSCNLHRDITNAHCVYMWWKYIPDKSYFRWCRPQAVKVSSDDQRTQQCCHQVVPDSLQTTTDPTTSFHIPCLASCHAVLCIPRWPTDRSTYNTTLCYY